MPATPSDLFSLLKSLGVETRTYEHVPVFTVAQSQAIKQEIPGGHSKNLFLKDKKGRIFLVVAEAATRIDLKRLHETIGASGRLSFGSAEQLRLILGVEPGSVTPFGLVNDRDRQVTLVLDEALMRGDPVNFHPLVHSRDDGALAGRSPQVLRRDRPRAADHAPARAAGRELRRSRPVPIFGLDFVPRHRRPEAQNMLAETPAAADGLVKDTTTAAFRQDVIQESSRQPVLVDFWAPWCGPCKQLTPVIEKAVKAAGGKVKLVKMNIDEHPQIPGQLGIQSIPAVIAFTKGQPVDGFMGALPESQVKGFIERLVGPVGPSPAEDLLAQADARAAEGDAGGAAELYAAVLAQDPENVAAIAALAKLHLDLDDLEGAKRFLAMAPSAKENDPAIVGARAAIELAEQAASLGDTGEFKRRLEANPLDHQARFDLALALNARGRREEAIDALIDIVRRERTWNDEAARKQLVQFFEAWGPTDDMTVLGRRRLSSVLFA